VNLRLTNRCNLHCKRCFPEPERSTRGELDRAEVLRLLEEVASYKPLHLTVTGGEPPLDGNLVEYLEFANARGMLALATAPCRCQPHGAERSGPTASRSTRSSGAGTRCRSRASTRKGA